MKKLLSVLLALAMLLSAAAFAEETDAQPELEDAGLDLGIHSVRYPRVTGMADEDLQGAVNARLVQAGGIDVLSARLAMVMQSQDPLLCTWTGEISGGVLTCVYLAEGPLEDARHQSRWSAVVLDLTTGEDVTLDDLFTDKDAALEAVSAYLEDEVAPAVSAHLDSAEFLPLPETFAVSPVGITFYYDASRLTSLSGRAGAVTVYWHTVREWVRTDEGSVPERIGAVRMLTPDASSKAAIVQAVTDGVLPGVPAKLGDSMETLVGRYQMYADPDFYDGGRYFQLQDPAFRTVMLMTDALSEKQYADSVVGGIRLDDGNVYGLVVGETTVAEWRAVLGEPSSSVRLDADAADAMRLMPGTSDYYAFGGHRLRLHADEDGVLRSILLIE